MKTVSDHLKRFPNARPSTLAHLELRSRKTEQLREEIEADKIRKAAGIFYPIRRAVRAFLGMEGA